MESDLSDDELPVTSSPLIILLLVEQLKPERFRADFWLRA